jgi:hypothetical protein
MEESIGEIKNSKSEEQEALKTQTLPNSLHLRRTLSKISKLTLQYFINH